jgi:GDP-mannose 6-dehydrogenase
MNVSVFGLGYVGSVSAACLAQDGHRLIGVDPNETKVGLVNEGQTPVIEEKVGELIAQAVRSGSLRATTSTAEAIAATDLAFVCVGTPSRANGSLDMRYVKQVSEEIGAALRGRDDFFVVVMRSTVLPGTTRGIVIPALEEKSGKKAGRDFGVCFHPEFLREGVAVYDYANPPTIISAATDSRSQDALNKINEHLDSPRIETDFETAEMIKYTNNAWHALKVGFANEIGAISKAVGVDGQKVMEILCQDTKLNISAKYLKPGFAFGGSCLPKDVRALGHKARSLDVELPILASILPSNDLHIDRAYQMIQRCGHRKVGILGLSFKAGTDDLRESPLVEMTEKLIGKGFDIRIYDRNVNVARLVGANRDYIYNHIPHISNLMVDDLYEVISHGDTLVIGNDDPAFAGVVSGSCEGKQIVDLVRINRGANTGKGYHGICW